MNPEELLDYGFTKKPDFEGWAWWQKRRGWYTLVLAGAMVIVFAIGWQRGFEAELPYLFLATVLTLGLANVCYSLPFLFEWLVHRASNGKFQLASWREPLFWVGGLLSVAVSVICALATVGDVIMRLHRVIY